MVTTWKALRGAEMVWLGVHGTLLRRSHLSISALRQVPLPMKLQLGRIWARNGLAYLPSPESP